MSMIKARGSVFLTAIAGIIILSGAFLAGAYFGVTNRPEIEKVVGLSNLENDKPEAVDFSAFWKAWNIINEKYVESNGHDNQKKVWGAISGLAESLDDPYTVFFNPEEFEIFRESITGEFQGVGMEVGMREKVLTVIAPLKGTPAFRAGIHAGDRIIQIDDKTTSNMSLEKAVSLIRGEKGSEVKLTILREGDLDTLEIKIIRDVIHIPTLETEVIPAKVSGGGEDPGAGNLRDGVFIIRLFNFNANAPSDFEKALRDFVRSGSNKLVIDLRNNPGGFLEASIEVASWFLPSGKVVVSEQLAGGEKGRVFRSKGYDIFKREVDVAILVNGGSASASEIVAGALREHGVAILVGEKTFGKGSVQELVEITGNTALKLTIAKWLTPGGHSISDGGLEPDVEVELSREDVEAERDPQMDKAIEILNN